MTNKPFAIALYVVAIVLLGAIAGAFCWVFFFLVETGIEFLWEFVPNAIGPNMWWWPIPVCLVGGLLCGLFQKKWPGQPKTMDEVLDEVKKTGRYEYDNIFVGFTGALLPLLFGGSIGPEAGLTGVIAGVCTWVGDRLKFLGREFRDLASVGVAAMAGVMFSAPLYGLAIPVFGSGENAQSMADAKVLVAKPFKIAIYILAIVSALGTLMLLSFLFGGMAGLPRFDGMEASAFEWALLLPLALVGTFVGWMFHVAGAAARVSSEAVGDKPVLKGVIAGLMLGILGSVLPYTMFAGESQGIELEALWMSIGAIPLIATALLKPFAIQFCVQFGWRGGVFFPMIFSGICVGYGMATLTGADPVFCVCACTAATLGSMMRQPLMAVLLLFLCFPVRYIIVLLFAAAIGSLIPLPTFAPKEQAQTQEQDQAQSQAQSQAQAQVGEQAAVDGENRDSADVAEQTAR